MATPVLKGNSIGIDAFYYSPRDTNGYIMGSSATAPTAGTQQLSPIVKLEGIKTLPLGLQEPERVTSTGDNGAIATRQFSPIDLPNGTATLGVFDMAFAAMCMGLTVEDVGAGRFLGLQPDEFDWQDMVLMSVTAVTSRTTANAGSTVYSGIIVPSAQIFWLDDGGLTERQPADFQFSVTMQKAAVQPWGEAFTGSKQYPKIRYTWPGYPMLERGTGDGTRTSFDLSYDVATNDADNVAVYVNGTALTWAASSPSAGEFSIDTSGGTGTHSLELNAAAADGAKIVLMYSKS